MHRTLVGRSHTAARSHVAACVILASIASAGVFGGCVAKKSATAQPIAAMGDLGPARLSLSAGDALGTAIFVNDLIIAMGEVPADFEVTTVPTNDIPVGE